MAAITLPAPGTALGPCAETCAHRDCAETHQIATAECFYCIHPIGYGTRFYTSAITGATYAHASCVEKAAIAAKVRK